MFDNITEQFQKSLKPANNLLAVNVHAVEKLAQQQTAFVTGLLNDGVTFTKNLAGQKDFNGVLEAQKAYAEDLQEKFMSAAKDAYAVMTEAQEQAGEAMKEVFAKARETTVAAAKSAPAGKNADK